MSRLVYIILFPFCMIEAFSQQTEVDILFEKASSLNTQGQYAKAAEVFRHAQFEAIRTNDIENYIQAITAEGECFYMLGATQDIKKLIDKAQQAYEQHSVNMGRIMGLKLREAILKLEGAYYSIMTDYNEGAYKKAYFAYNQCLMILDSLRIESNIYIDELEQTIYRELLNLYYKQKRYNEALEIVNIIFDFRNEIGFNERGKNIKTENYTKFVDAYVSRALVLARLKRFNEAMEVLNQLPNQCNSEPAVVRAKGKVLMLQYAFEGVDNRKQAQKYYASYIQYIKDEVTQQLETLNRSTQEQYWLAMHSFLYDCYCLEDFSTEMLYDLALYSKGFLVNYNRIGEQSKCNWKKVKNNLRPHECAIEFVQYIDHTEEKQLAAFVLKKDSKNPRFVKIGAVQDFETYLLRNYETLEKASTSDNATSKNFLYTDTTLFARIWSPELLDVTDGCTTIYFSPDGFLHQLAIEYMHPQNDVECKRLSSTRELTRNDKAKIDSYLLVGGIDYSADTSPIQTGNDVIGYYTLANRNLYINYLYGANEEIDNIRTILHDIETCKYTVLKEDSATDEHFFRQVGRGYSALHIATHGYFCGRLNFTDLQPLFVDRCLSECGLIMAGACRNLNDSNFNATYQDGVITAKELMGVDLTGVKLMVLSACQSGIGQITQDGVYGMQRALKMAGVGAMIVSLWSVDDGATAKFMTHFYEELARSENIHQSFKYARAMLLKSETPTHSSFSSSALSRRAQQPSFSAPQYANAFILIDAI